MRLIISLLLFLTIYPAASGAGDFGLTVCDDKTRFTGPHNASWPILSAEEIDADIRLYASGGDTHDIFATAFSEADVVFCSNREVDLVRASFIQAITTAKKQRVKDLIHFLQTLGSKKSVSTLSAALMNKNLSPVARKRLLEAKDKIANDRYHYREKGPLPSKPVSK